ILGYEKEALERCGYLMLTIYHPDDLHKWEERLVKFKSIEDKEVIESEYRMKNASGDWVWLYGKEVLFKRNNNGDPKVILGISLDITDLKFIEYKLIEKNEELSRSNADLDRFVYSASHDLRAPLNSVMGLITVAKMETSDKQAIKYMDLMAKSVKKLDNFVQDLINFSRNSRMEVENQVIDFKDIIQDIFEGLKFFEGSEKIEKIINIKVSEDFYSDKTQLHIILSNIISNAIRYHNYSRDEPYVAVNVKTNKEKLVIEIKDNGQGIGEEHINKIFDVFYRASYTKEGSGLGLYIVKEAVKKINGEISVKSAINQGTSFTIAIPNKVPFDEVDI
nr:PAS domain-containing sensor histidine kinase [Bacteroidota bacterium]